MILVEPAVPHAMRKLVAVASQKSIHACLHIAKNRSILSSKAIMKDNLGKRNAANGAEPRDTNSSLQRNSTVLNNQAAMNYFARRHRRCHAHAAAGTTALGAR